MISLRQKWDNLKNYASTDKNLVVIEDVTKGDKSLKNKIEVMNAIHLVCENQWAYIELSKHRQYLFLKVQGIGVYMLTLK